MGFKADSGSFWGTINSATATYPTDGRGAGTTNSALSVFSLAGNSTSTPTQVVADGLLILTAHSAATTITILAMDGTTALHVIPVAVAAAAIGAYYLQLGGPNGLNLAKGFSYTTSNVATTAYVYYRIAV